MTPLSDIQWVKHIIKHHQVTNTFLAVIRLFHALLGFSNFSKHTQIFLCLLYPFITCPLLPHTLDPLRVLFLSLPCPCVYALPARTSRCLRGVTCWRSRRRLSEGSPWTVTGPLLDFYCLLICTYDYISHPSIGHCDHYAAS